MKTTAAGSNSKDLPLVLAQRTERNERICSLLSAVLLRRVARPSERPAILASFPSSFEAGRFVQHTTSSADGGGGERAPFVVVLKPKTRNDGSHRENSFRDAVVSTLEETLRPTAMMFAVLRQEDTVVSSRIMDRLFATLHPKTPVFVVALWEAADWFQNTDLASDDERRRRRRSAMLKGVLLVHPTAANSSSACNTEAAFVPTLIVNYDQNIQPDPTIYNPNVILSLLPGNQAEEKCECLWLARTMLKFIQATLQTAPTSEQRSTTTKQSSTTKAMGITFQLGSRL